MDLGGAPLPITPVVQLSAPHPPAAPHPVPPVVAGQAPVVRPAGPPAPSHQPVVVQRQATAPVPPDAPPVVPSARPPAAQAPSPPRPPGAIPTVARIPARGTPAASGGSRAHASTGDPPAPAATRRPDPSRDAHELEELARRLIEPVGRLLRAELRHDRERAGRLHDRRR